MAVDSPMDSLLERLRLDDPWVPPRLWDSQSQPPSHSHPPLYNTSTLSEPSLVRLAINALQGLESALISIEKISASFHCSSADRTSHRIPSLWTRCSSTAAVGNVLTSIGQFGWVVFILQRFVKYFTCPAFGGVEELEENRKSDSSEEGKGHLHNLTIVNQAFAISVGKVIDGYISALNTLSASVSLRRYLKTDDGGCLTSIGHSEITLLEVYLHTIGLRTQIEALGSICNVNHLTACCPVSSVEDLTTKADLEFRVFPRSGALLSFLYAQLKVADPDHCMLLKFLFLQSYGPYCDFIRSWIYDGSISDPYCEFVVEFVSDLSMHTSGDTGTSSALPLPTIRVQDGAAVPCFLEECLVPLCRTGQQLQVVMKLLELSNNVGTCDNLKEILPQLVGLSSKYPWFAFPLTFDKKSIETMVIARASYYQQMLEKFESILTTFDFSVPQVAPQLVNNLKENLNYLATSASDESLALPLTDRSNQHMLDAVVDSEISSIVDEYSYTEDLLESSECSSSEGSEEQNENEKLIPLSRNLESSYLSALHFSLSLSTDNKLPSLYQSGISCSMEDLQFEMNRKSGYAAYTPHKETYLASGFHARNIGSKFSVLTETPAACINTSDHFNIEDSCDMIIENNAKSCNICSSPLKNDAAEVTLLPSIFGGSAWESLLSRSEYVVNRSTRDHRIKLLSGADMPMDFVIKRCVLDEILLQYKYLSKLAINLLVEGFKLQEHLNALRCYHFMELADWADLFIMSLWRRKWHVNELDKRIAEIQGVLELAVQRSSCEGDPNKDRLYVYLKGDGIRHLASSAMGIHSFDFLCLGYRVDWPVSIILTPGALNIYSEIFNFLIKVKLAVFSLSDAWCTLKAYCMEQHKEQVHQISVLNETRHKINHFVSTLQQYVQSQLSQVSWYRFLHSLHHKVKDMLDLESVHMAYLTESVHICFLSNETRSIASILQNVLQCAMDFGSCLTGSIAGPQPDDVKSTNRFSQIDISQVHFIRKSFAKNLEDLYAIYLKSPKHGEFGLSRFWDYLNYNEYYAGVMSKQIGHCIFY